MATLVRNGIVLELPDHVSIAEDAQPERRGSRTAPTTDTGITVEQVAETLRESADLEIVDLIPLIVNTASMPPPGRRGGPPSPDAARLTIDVGPDEEAVILVEDEGYYRWVTGSREGSQPGNRRGASGRSSITFTFDVGREPTAADGVRPDRRGPILEAIIKPITTIVFRFVARVVVGHMVKRLERSVVTGAVKVTGADLDKWITTPTKAELALPSGRRAKVLLMVHGTFSSTRGGFGSLTSTDEGKAFLQRAVARYDLVLGCDHRTLSEDPMDNAEQLLDLLRGLVSPLGIDVDAITHSRGALVLRSLTEQLLAAEDDIAVHKAVLVAGPNAGTLLASPTNWSTLVDLYTNFAVDGCRLISLAGPEAATVSNILGESLKAIAVLVKSIVAEAADEQRVPGLAAMMPGGTFLSEINQPASADHRLGTRYFTVSSDFEVAGLSGPQELPTKLLRWVADDVVDRLMGESNDLVVNVASMGSIDGGAVAIRQSASLGANPLTYHCSYFVAPAVVQSLDRWIINADGAEVSDSRVDVDGDPSAPIGTTVYAMPDVIDTNVALVEGGTSIGDTASQVRARDHDFAVIRMLDKDNLATHYALRPGELYAISDGVPPDATWLHNDVLQASPPSPISTNTLVRPLTPVTNNAPWAQRTVVVLDGNTVGVVPPANETPPGNTNSENRPAPAGAEEGRPSRRRRSAPANPAAVERAVHAQAYFRAETDSVVTTSQNSLVLVDISLEEFDAAVESTVHIQKSTVDTARPITVYVVPRINLEVDGDRMATVQPPLPGEPRSLNFSVIGTHEGPGQVLVIASQGPVDLVKIVIDVTVTARAPSGGNEDSTPKSVTAAMPPMPQVAACDVMTVEESKIVGTTGPAGAQQETVLRTQFLVRYLSEGLDEWEPGTTEPIEGDRLAYVKQLYQQIEADWGDSDADAERFTSALRAFGGQLFDELIPETIQKILWDNRDTIKQIQINSVEPLIPWEIVHLKSPGGKLPDEERFLATMGLVRWIDGANYPPRQITVGAGRARALAPTYPADSGWRLDEPAAEFLYLKRVFGATRVDSDINDVLSMLKQPGEFDLLHFAGHGMAKADDIANAAVIIQVRRSGGRWVPIPLTATMVDQYANLRKDKGNRPSVFLNACQVGQGGYNLTKAGGFAQAFLKGGAGMFISTLWSVLDEPARKFTEYFYGHLLSGKTVAEAATAARLGCRQAGDPTWLAYVVYGRPDGHLVRV